jgi:hypothetical protein
MSCILSALHWPAGECNFVTYDAPTHTHTHTHTHPEYPSVANFERTLGDEKVREQPLVFDSFAALPERVVAREEYPDDNDNGKHELSN